MEQLHWKWLFISLTIHAGIVGGWIGSEALFGRNRYTPAHAPEGPIRVSIQKPGPAEQKHPAILSDNKGETHFSGAEPAEIDTPDIGSGQPGGVFDSADRLPAFLVPFRSNYPETARLQGIEGEVTLIVTLDETGAVEDVQVQKSSHPLLEREAVTAMRKACFSPALSDGKPVRFRFTYRVVFSL